MSEENSPDKFVPALGFSTKLPFRDRHFDCVLSSLFFHHLLPDAKQLTFREVHRVLKPGGQL
ncbi:MAG: class I SAM-dependent methyltransferase, partial [Gammaproteobacteria bacterium]